MVFPVGLASIALLGACKPVCTGATCADRFSLADVWGIPEATATFVPEDASGHIAGQDGDGRLRSLARAGENALLVGVPDASRVTLYGAAFYLGTADVEIDGEPGDGFGAAVSAGEQVVVGAPRVGDGPSLPSIGRVYVFPWALPEVGSSLADAVQIVDGANAADGFGSVVAACGDFDGDGAADAVAAAPSAEDLAGRVVLIPNGAGVDLSAGDLQGWSGSAPGSWLGSALGCGDFDGDGLDDVVLGEPYAAGATEGAAGVVRIEGRDGPLVRLEGRHGDGYFGASIAVGDVDADGVPDLVVGASGRPSADADADDLGGTVHVFSGAALRAASAGGLPPALIADVATLTGDNPRGRFGDTVAIGDVDADGTGDVMVGAPGSNTGNTGEVGAQTGALYVFQGPFGGGVTPTLHDDRDPADAMLTIEGSRVYQRVGEAAVLVDLDASEGDDVLFTTREKP